MVTRPARQAHPLSERLDATTTLRQLLDYLDPMLVAKRLSYLGESRPHGSGGNALLKDTPSFDRRFCERPFPPVTIAARCSGVGLLRRRAAPRFDGER